MAGRQWDKHCLHVSCPTHCLTFVGTQTCGSAGCCSADILPLTTGTGFPHRIILPTRGRVAGGAHPSTRYQDGHVSCSQSSVHPPWRLALLPYLAPLRGSEHPPPLL